MKIEDIQVGGLYNIPHYVTPLYNLKDPASRSESLSNTILPGDTPFVPLEVHQVVLNSHFFPYKENVWHRIRILTSEGIIGWLSLRQDELDYIVPVTSCDKEL